MRNHRIIAPFKKCVCVCFFRTVSNETGYILWINSRRKKSYALTCNIILSIAWCARCSLYSYAHRNFPHESACNKTWLHLSRTYYEQLIQIRKRHTHTLSLKRKHLTSHMFGNILLHSENAWWKKVLVNCVLFFISVLNWCSVYQML